MDDKKLKEIFNTLCNDNMPPEGLKESMFLDILQKTGEQYRETEPSVVELNFWQCLFFEKPLRAAATMSASLSAILWVIFRDGYINLLSGLIGVR